MRLSKKQFDNLTKEDLIKYITESLQEQVNLVERKQLSSEAFTKSAWPYYQACALGEKKAYLKILEKITYND